MYKPGPISAKPLAAILGKTIDEAFARQGFASRELVMRWTEIAGEEIVTPEIEEPPKVVDLMEALRRSLNSVSTEKKKPAKVVMAKTAKAKAANGARKRKAG